jgi:hypothetical protein
VLAGIPWTPGKGIALRGSPHGRARLASAFSASAQAEKADDACVRARVDSSDGATLLHSEHGVKHCLTDDLAHAWPVNLHGYSNALVDRAVVAVERRTRRAGRPLTIGSTRC